MRMRLWRLGAFTAATLLGLANGGCSFSYDLGAFSRKDTVERTASIKPSTMSDASSAAPLMPEPDLALAKAAVHDLLSRGGEDTSVPWENPRTGARGTVTPIAASYIQDGLTCREFLASYVRGQTESWLQGEACRVHQGKWEVRSLRPMSGGTRDG
jgi:surface antigen